MRSDRHQLEHHVYLYCSKEIPCELIYSIIDEVSNFDKNYSNGNKLGLMGITFNHVKKNNGDPLKTLNNGENIKIGTMELKRLLMNTRLKYPDMTLHDWYASAISAFINNKEVDGSICERSKIILEKYNSESKRKI